MAADPYMTVTEALALICFRDAAFAAECRTHNGRRMAIEYAAHLVHWREHVDRQRPLRSIASARKVLKAKCYDGRVVATGLPSDGTKATSKRRQIGPDEWADLSITQHDDNGATVVPIAERIADWWREVEFRRADVLDCFSALTDIAPARPSSQAEPRSRN